MQEYPGVAGFARIQRSVAAVALNSGESSYHQCRRPFPFPGEPYTFTTNVPAAFRPPVHTRIGAFGPGAPGPGPSGGSRVSVEQKVIEIVCEHLAVNKEQ